MLNRLKKPMVWGSVLFIVALYAIGSAVLAFLPLYLIGWRPW